jgi:hypothetical protein
MIFYSAIVLGALIGYLRAARRGGSRFDRLQYAAVHAIFFAIIGLFVTIFILRMS